MNDKEIPGWFDFEDIYDQAVEAAGDGDTLVEVGSWMGKSAVYLARRVQESGKRLRVVCVDPWKGTPGTQLEAIVANYGGSVFQEFQRNVAEAGCDDVIEAVVLPSVEGAKLFEDESLAFVFLDGDHSYEAVHADIRAWLPKLKRGGALAGHDYDRRDTVRRAVLERFGDLVEERKPRSWSVAKGGWYYSRRAEGELVSARLCLALCAKNEAGVIARCIESAAPWVDGVVCVDTGSTDDTMGEARRACDRLGLLLTLHERPWKNFAESQTELLELAKQSGYVYAWHIDADEVIRQTAPVGPLELNESAYAVCRVWAEDWEVWSPRIFRLDCDWAYEGERHAVPRARFPSLPPVRLHGFEVQNRRDGAHGAQAQAEQRARFGRDVVHFLERVFVAGEVPRSWYYLAQSAHDAGWRELALWAYRRRMHIDGGLRDEAYVSALQVSRYTGEREGYRKALEIDPTRHEAYVEFAALERQHGNPAKALAIAIQAEHLPHSTARFLVSRSAYTWRPTLERLLAQWDLGDRSALTAVALLYEQHRTAPRAEEIWREFERLRELAVRGAPTVVGVSVGKGRSESAAE